MKIKLYSTNCPKCNVLKMKLKQLQLDYELVENTEEAVKVGQSHGINSAPILEADGKFMDFATAVQFLKEVK